MKNYLVYLAGPITGLSFAESIEWRQYVIENLDSNIHGLSPLRNKEYLADCTNLGDEYPEWPLSTQRGIYARDKFDCARADVILVNLLGSKTVSIGTVMEIAWAAQNNTPVVLMMEPDNIHDHSMLREACPFIVDDLDAAVVLVNAIVGNNPHE